MQKVIVKTDAAPKAIGPYSQAIIAGNFVFASGQIALDPATGGLTAGGIAEQTERVIANLLAVLEASGATVDDVVKTTVFLVDMNDFAAMNEVYARYFGAFPPARACIEVSRLPKDVLVEIEAVAWLET